jgi:hypothetical protein
MKFVKELSFEQNSRIISHIKVILKQVDLKTWFEFCYSEDLNLVSIHTNTK